jgi:tetratricopeptide (TPR) repeat protein
MLNLNRMLINEPAGKNCCSWIKLLICFLHYRAFVALKAIFLAALIFTGSCGSVAVYQPDPKIKPSMMAMEAQRTIQEMMMQTGVYNRYKDVHVTMDGFSFAEGYPSGSQSRSYNFRDLPALVVLRDKDYFCYKVNLGDCFIIWLSLENAKKFVDAVNAINYYTSSKLIAEDTESFNEFKEKAKAWRALPQKPDIPEDTRRYKVLAEDAFRNKNYDMAVGYYEKGLESCPFWPDGHFNAALLCGETGMYAKAVCHMKRYLELCPDAKDTQAARDKMYIWEEKIRNAGLDSSPTQSKNAEQQKSSMKK